MATVREIAARSGTTPVERMYFAWNDALSRNDAAGLLSLYPRDAGKGEQMDFTEVVELNDKGLIQRHCVYWGWVRRPRAAAE